MEATRSQTLLPVNFTLNEYDFGPVFPDEDLLLGDGGAYSNEMLSDSSPTDVLDLVAVSDPPAEIGQPKAPTQKQRLERRGHTKSRAGCFNCKRRRIKCQETRPSCGHCVKTGLKCEYPTTPTIIHQPHHQIPLFSLQDMRFFQHFMLHCYPHQPIKNENIWTHEHEFLMHAILGMAACDLMKEDPSLLEFAMAHRVKAIKAIKKSLAELPKNNNTASSEHANALVATCFALTFQSTTFEDGMAEFMTFIRGILIVGAQMMIKGIKPIFVNILDQDSKAVLKPKMVQVPLIKKEWADGAVEAIGGLRHLCRDVVEIQYYDLLMDMATKLHISSWEAYEAIGKHYGWWMQLPHEKFQRVINPLNQTMILLATHWVSLQQVMVTITRVEHECREKAPEPKEDSPDLGIIRWLRYLNKQIDYEHQIYNQWPLWVEYQLNRDLSFFGKRPPS